MPDHRLRKEERLKSAKQLNALFNRGQSFVVFPIRFVWFETDRDGSYPVRVAFSAAKRHWKRAVDRNLLKRRMREAYRSQKEILYKLEISDKTQIHLSCVYIGGTPVAFTMVSSAMRKGLIRIASRLQENQPKQPTE